MKTNKGLPLVSVLTIVKNGESSIVATIDSVIKQNYINIEYVIIDGGSNDKTINLINEKIDSRIIFLKVKDNGVYYGMNNAIHKSKGDLIAILNCGDFFVDNDVITKVVNLYNKTPDKMSVFNGGIRFVNNEGKKITDLIRKEPIMHLKYFFMPINHPAFFVPKKVYEAYGVFNTDFKVGADYEFVLRLAKNKVNFCFFSDICTSVKPLGLSSYSNNKITQLKECFAIRQLFINSVFNKAITIILFIAMSRPRFNNKDRLIKN